MGLTCCKRQSSKLLPFKIHPLPRDCQKKAICTFGLWQLVHFLGSWCRCASWTLNTNNTISCPKNIIESRSTKPAMSFFSYQQIEGGWPIETIPNPMGEGGNLVDWIAPCDFHMQQWWERKTTMHEEIPRVQHTQSSSTRALCAAGGEKLSMHISRKLLKDPGGGGGGGGWIPLGRGSSAARLVLNNT